MERTEDSLRDHWDNIKGTNFRNVWVPEEEETKEGYENRHTETNNTITEIKNTLEGINSRIPEAEE